MEPESILPMVLVNAGTVREKVRLTNMKDQRSTNDMDETYDVWVDFGYEGWAPYEDVDLAEMLRLTDRPEEEVIVYKHKDRQLD